MSPPPAALLSPVRPSRRASAVRSPSGPFCPEDLLLLSCARPSPGPECVEGIGDLMRAGLNWQVLLEKAFRHGVAPLLYFRLNELYPDETPRDVRDRLRKHFDANLRRNLFLAGELYRVLELFRGGGIPGVPFRGIDLAASVYRNLALRQFTDLDILVGKGDVRRACKLLLSLGYRPQYDLSGSRWESFLESECELLLSRENQRVFLDLHWETAPRYFAFHQDPGRLMARRLPGPRGGCPHASFSPEDTLLLLSSHAARHLWERLIWTCDVAWLIESHGDLDWRGVLEEARVLGGERILLVGLHLARDLLGAVLPEEVADRLDADPEAPGISRELGDRLLRGSGEVPNPRDRFHYHVLLRERWRDRMRYLARLAAARPPRRGRQPPPLPSFLLPFHFLARALALAGKYGPGSLKRSLFHERRQR